MLLMRVAVAEVLRQQAIAGGAGGSRVVVKRLAGGPAGAEGGDGAAVAKGGKSAGRGHKSIGYEGEAGSKHCNTCVHRPQEERVLGLAGLGQVPAL
jgi:hypothetical protein